MKSYIIHVPENETSVELATDCVNSLKSLNMKYELFHAVSRENIKHTFFEKKKLKLFPKQNDNKKRIGVLGCFISHFSLWEKCIQLNEPIIILEHDALFLRPLPNNILSKFTDVL